MAMMRDTAAVVNTILYESSKHFGEHLRPMKLQKLLYFCFGRCLVDNNIQDRIIEEDFEAWPYGPVVPSVYYSFREYGYSHIHNFGYDNAGKRKMIAMEKAAEIYHQIIETLEIYVGYADLKLSEMTHRLDGAWWATKKKDSTVIELGDIKNEFKI